MNPEELNQNQPEQTADSVADDAPISLEKQKEVLDKYETDSVVEENVGKKSIHVIIVDVLMFIMAVYVIYSAGFGSPFTSLAHRSIFLCMALPCVFLTYPAVKKNKGSPPKWYDWVLSFLAFAMTLYIFIETPKINLRMMIPIKIEYYVFFITLLLVLESVRRTSSKALIILILVFVFYAFTGKYLPAPFTHVGLNLKRIVSGLLLNPEGIYGNNVGVVSSMIGLFVIFGAFLDKTGVGQFLNDVGNAVAGHASGGPAKVAVVTSALFGTVSGNAVSNVVTTGTFTIPMMKKIGYNKEFAGAVEAVASTAGQLMPPIMGSSAFLMASYIGVSYGKICLAAIVPVALYYTGCFTMVHMRAKKLGLEGLPKEQLPKLKEIVFHDGYLAIPFLFVIVMLILNYTVTFVGFWAIIVCVVVAALKKKSRLSLKDIVECFIRGGRRVLSIAATCAGIGIIIGVCSMTGLVQTIGSIIVKLGGGMFLPTILIVAVLAIIMGMGMATATVYMLLATIAAPTLVRFFNVPILAAHFFVFYFGLMACLTPPVCIPAYAAASLAEAEPNKVGWQSFILGLGGFIVPFLFIYSPDILFINPTIATIPKIVTSILGVFMLGSAIEGWLNGRLQTWQRLAMICAAVLMILPETMTDIIGIAVLVIVIAIQSRRNKVRPVSA